MPKDDSVVSGEPIEASWGNQVVRDKLVQRATNAADLASGWPAPQDGETVYQLDTEQLWIYDGTQWVEMVRNPALWLPISGGTMTGTLKAISGENFPIVLTLDTTDYFEGSPPLRAVKSADGMVQLSGRFDNVDPGTIGEPNVLTLPVGYRPAGASCNLALHDQASGPALRAVVSAATGLLSFTGDGPGYWCDLTGQSFYAGWQI